MFRQHGVYVMDDEQPDEMYEVCTVSNEDDTEERYYLDEDEEDRFIHAMEDMEEEYEEFQECDDQENGQA